MITAVLGEIPAVVFALLTIEKKEFGRKNSLIIFFGVSIVTNYLCF